MNRQYGCYSYFSASKFIEINADSLKDMKSCGNEYTEIEDGSVICFLDDEFNLPMLFHNPEALKSSYMLKAYYNGSIIQVPAWSLLNNIQSNDFCFENEYLALTRALTF